MTAPRRLRDLPLGWLDLQRAENPLAVDRVDLDVHLEFDAYFRQAEIAAPIFHFAISVVGLVACALLALQHPSFEMAALTLLTGAVVFALGADRARRRVDARPAVEVVKVTVALHQTRLASVAGGFDIDLDSWWFDAHSFIGNYAVYLRPIGGKGGEISLSLDYETYMRFCDALQALGVLGKRAQAWPPPVHDGP